MQRVICAKMIAASQTIVNEKIINPAEQLDVFADFGAELANWYIDKIPDNNHAVLVGFKGVLIPVLKSHKPIWDVMSKFPHEAHVAFIEGFCDPARLDEEALQHPDAIDPEIIN